MSEPLLTGSLEDNVITLLAWSNEHAPIVSLKVAPELYSTRAYQKIARLAVDYLGTYGKPPRAHLRDLLEEDLRRGDEGRFLTQVMDAMDRLHEEMQPEYVLPQLDRFIAQRKLSMVLSKSMDQLHAGDLEAAQETLSQVEYKTDEQPGVFFDGADWLKFLDRDPEEETFSSGIDLLDQRDVIPRRRTLFLVIAPTGEGKSFWLRQIAIHNAIILKKKVLFITLENDLDETLQFLTMAALGKSSSDVERLRVPVFDKDKFGRLAQLNFAEVTPDRITPEKKAVIRKALKPLQKRAGRLLVKWFPTSTLTIPMLMSYLDMLAKTQNFVPDMLVLDYIDLMQTDSRDLRISLGNLTKGVRGLAGMRNLAAVSASQGNRQSSEARVVNSNMVAEDWSKIGTADVVCTLSRTLDEKELGIGRVLVAKSRRSRDKWLALISQSYATGQFCLDSVFFDKLSQSEVRRVTGEEKEEE